MRRRGVWLAVAWWGVVVTAAWGNEQKLIDDALWRLSGAASDIQRVKVIAVAPFEYGAGVEGRNVEEKIVRILSRGGRFNVVDRRALDRLLQEQALSMSGITEESDLKKVGRLINVEAFLFGKVTRAGERLVVNLDLRDVATGGLVWSEEFEGENPDQASMGMGIRVGSFGMTSRTYVSGGGLSEFANLQTNDGGTYIAFLGHFVQRFGWTKVFSFGADAIFSRGDWTANRHDAGVLGGAYHLYQLSTYRDWNLTLIPLLRFHPAYLLGMKGDVLVLYGGVGFSGDYLGVEGTFRYKKSDGTGDSGEIKYDRVDLYPGNISWKAGAEMRFTENLSMFFEAYALPGITAKFENIHSAFAPEFSVQSKLYYGFGAKYYFMMF